MRNLFWIVFALIVAVFCSCSDDEGNACRSFYSDLCSRNKYFDEPEEYYYKQKSLFCDCIKDKRSEFTDYEKMECDRYLSSIDYLDESIPDQKQTLQNCAVNHQLLKKYGDTYISYCQLRNGTDRCKEDRNNCIKACPTSSDEEYKGCIATCNGRYPCDKICSGFDL
jgi:hypothetical protein